MKLVCRDHLFCSKTLGLFKRDSVVGRGIIIDDINEGENISIVVEGVMLPVGGVLWAFEDSFAANGEPSNEHCKSVQLLKMVLSTAVRAQSSGEVPRSLFWSKGYCSMWDRTHHGLLAQYYHYAE